MNDVNEFLYPDILGMLAGERLVIDDMLECALGIFPACTAVGQPVEALLLLQSLIEQPLDLQIVIRTPLRDTQERLLNIFTPRPRLSLTLPGGEVGLYHLPVTPQPPTPPGNGYPVSVQITVQKPDYFQPVHRAARSIPPNLLVTSPLRLSVLRDVKFAAQTQEANQLEVTFDILPNYLLPGSEPMPYYEALWTATLLEQEQAKAKEMGAEALRFVRGLTCDSVYPLLVNHTRDRYGDAGIPLHPAEAIFIAKMLTHTVQGGLDLESGLSLAEGRWFKSLSWLMANNPDVLCDLNQLMKIAYSSVVYDAVRLGLRLLARSAKVNLGDEEEQMNYSAGLVAALEGRAALGLEHVYVPLVLVGTLLNAQVVGAWENPWRSLSELEEARAGRGRLVGTALREVFDLLDRLIGQSERQLQEKRIPRR
jgi:hypothetical protein